MHVVDGCRRDVSTMQNNADREALRRPGDARARQHACRHRFPDRSLALPPLAHRVRRRRRLSDHGRRSGRRARRLRAQAQFLRSRRRHRIERRRAAAALRASGGARRGHQVGQGQCVLRRRQYPHAGQVDARRQGELLQVHQRDAAGHRGRQRQTPSRPTSAPSTAMPPAAATSWRSPPTTSCWSTTAARRWRCRRRRCSRCCPAPAGSPASPTSARCGATAPTCSARSRRASAAPRRSTGGWSTRWCRIRNGRTRSPRARTRSPRAPTGRRTPRALRSTPLERKIEADRVVLFARRRRDRPRARPCQPSPCAGRRKPCRPRSKPRMRSATSSGRSPWRANWKTPSCICAPTRRPSASCCSAPTAMRKPCSTHDDFLGQANGDWLMREIRHYLKRVLKRVDVTPKSFIALIEPGSCFAGTLAELAFAADRSLMLIGTREGDNRKPAAITLGPGQFRLLSDGQWADAAADALPRRAARRSSTLQGQDRRADRGGRGRRARPRHLRPTRTSTGTTNCASCWRSARASRPTP